MTQNDQFKTTVESLNEVNVLYLKGVSEALALLQKKINAADLQKPEKPR